MARKLILDVDTGTDDAVAIMLAALHPELELLGCTTVNGNVAVEHCTDNSLRVLDHIGRSEVPVFQGQGRPLVRPGFPSPRQDRGAASYHVATLELPAPTSRPQAVGAVEFLIETFRAATDPVALVAVAPLTNLAAAITLDPGFAARVPELVIMGGGHWTGNVTPSAEFNIWADPEAAAVVFGAPFPRRTLVPLDATHKALVGAGDCARLAALGTPAATASAAFIGHRIEAYDRNQPMATAGAAPVHDAVCVASLVEPAVIATHAVHVAVETVGTLTVGRTVMDVGRRGGGAPDTHLAFDADPRRFVELLVRTFAPPS